MTEVMWDGVGVLINRLSSLLDWSIDTPFRRPAASIYPLHVVKNFPFALALSALFRTRLDKSDTILPPSSPASCLRLVVSSSFVREVSISFSSIDFVLLCYSLSNYRPLKLSVMYSFYAFSPSAYLSDKAFCIWSPEVPWMPRDWLILEC